MDDKEIGVELIKLQEILNKKKQALFLCMLARYTYRMCAKSFIG